ncbi:hypothetical protein J1605_001022 [Eschrichtius robustus]|uniref:Uncharacterized protein n=1 Tax=Eschrichtius robustus TaxID=9764 RepID=A0AB34GRC4_ESCRO|nr:hypothetical protein J1605_001022 [Eschrichtius robustus]
MRVKSTPGTPTPPRVDRLPGEVPERRPPSGSLEGCTSGCTELASPLFPHFSVSLGPGNCSLCLQAARFLPPPAEKGSAARPSKPFFWGPQREQEGKRLRCALSVAWLGERYKNFINPPEPEQCEEEARATPGLAKAARHCIPVSSAYVPPPSPPCPRESVAPPPPRAAHGPRARDSPRCAPLPPTSSPGCVHLPSPALDGCHGNGARAPPPEGFVCSLCSCCFCLARRRGLHFARLAPALRALRGAPPSLRAMSHTGCEADTYERS